MCALIHFGRVMIVLWLTVIYLAVCSSPVYAETPAEIVSAVYRLKQPSLDAKLQKAGFSAKPDYYTMRLYKANAEIEIWAGTSDAGELTKIATYPICAMDFAPGTKLKEGDKRTPEGSFKLDFSYRSSQWFMHIDLNHIDREGDVKKGPAFFMCTDYPTSFDKKLSKSIGINNPGSAICVHGNCASVGCASMENDDYVEIYYWMMQHNIKKYGAPRAHILPFRFYETCRSEPERIMYHVLNTDYKLTRRNYCPTAGLLFFKNYAAAAELQTDESRLLGKAKIQALWKHIQDREVRFLISPTPANAELEMSMDILNGI